MLPISDKPPLKADPSSVSQVLLLIDSDAESVRLVRKAFRLNPLVNRLIVVRSAREALEVLQQQGRHARDPRPTLVLMDLNLDGGIDAAETTMRDIKSLPELESIPVIVMGTNVPEENVNRVYAAKVNCFIQKPSDPLRFQELVLTTCQFWLAVANWSQSNNGSAMPGTTLTASAS
jgi:CheY-like chemotaxis protein